MKTPTATPPDKERERAAKRRALAHINKHRAEQGRPPLRQVTKLWWSLYRNDWLT